MENSTHNPGLGSIYALLSQASRRPRYAFLVLQLVAELADQNGRAGPFVRSQSGTVLLRDWLCEQLLPISEQSGRRTALRTRIKSAIEGSLSGNPDLDAARVERAVDEQVRAVGRANVSRAVSELVKAGIMSRFYQGYATNHEHPGGRRNVVYVINPEVLRLLPRLQPPLSATAKPLAPPLVPQVPSRGSPHGRCGARQGDLFAA